MENRLIKWFFLALSILLLSISAQAATLHVPSEYSTIQAALDAAVGGDVIQVAEGEYHEALLFNKDISAISLIGSGYKNTAVDSISIHNHVIGTITIEGFTVSGEFSLSGKSGSNSYRVRNCKIKHSLGLQCVNHWGGTSYIENNIISGGSLGILLIQQPGNVVIQNNTITNHSYYGIYYEGYADVTIRNNIIAFNRYGVFLWIDPSEIDDIAISYNNTWGNTDASYWYRDVFTYEEQPFAPIPGTGEISDDPLFYEEVDYHLSIGSPCFNAGDPSGNYTGQTDIDGEPRVMGERVDMGADECTVSEMTIYRSGASVNLWEEINPDFSLLDSIFDGGVLLADGLGLATAEYLFYLPKPIGPSQQIQSISVTINGDNPWLSTPYAYIGTDPSAYSLYWDDLEYGVTGQAARNLLVDASTIDNSDNIGSVLKVCIATFDVFDRYDVNSITVKYECGGCNYDALSNFHKSYSAARFFKTFKEEMVDGPYSPWNGNPNEQRFFMGINRANAFAQNLTGLAEPLPKAVKTFNDEIKILYSLVDLIDEGFDYFNFLLKYDTGVGPYGDGPQPVEIATSLQNASDALNTLAQSYQDIGFDGLTDDEYPTLSNLLDDALSKLENLKGLLENSKIRLYNIYHDRIDGYQTAEGLLYSLRPLLWYDFDTTSITLKPDSYLLQLIQDVNAQSSQFVTANFGIVPSDKGLHYTVDGTDYTTNQTFTWLSYAPHTISASSTLMGNDGYTYEFDSWSDGGSRSHSITPASDTTYTVTYTAEKQAPTPNPMTWDMEPYETSTSSISMTATVASDDSPPVYYEFDFVDSPTGGSGGDDRSWSTDITYTDSGLGTNHQYGYRVRARDSAPAQNTTDYSTVSYDYTDIETPSGITFGAITTTNIEARSSDTPSNLTSGSSGLIIYNVTNGTDSGWKQNNDYWNSGSLSVNTQYGFKARARNGDADETPDSPIAYRYTYVNPPAGASFSNITQTSIQANWTANGNPAGTQYLCENTSRGTNSGWISYTYWSESGLTCGTQYCYQVRAKNGDGVETTPTSLICQYTSPCPAEINVKQGLTNIPDDTGNYDFGTVSVGQNKPVTFTVENLGGSNLDLTGSPKVQISGTDAGDFEVTQEPSTPVGPSSPTIFEITFTPSDTDLRTASVSIPNSDADENPYNFSLSGTGVLTKFNITDSAGANGTVEPNGVFDVNLGSDVLFTAEPNFGYMVNEWYLDSNLVPDHNESTTFTLYDIQSNHAVYVTFKVIPAFIYVDVNSPNEPGTGTPEDPFRKIQYGIDAAFDGMTVIVADGIYTGEGNRDIDFEGKAITVRSVDPNDPNVVAATVIDCNGTEVEPHRGFYFHTGEDTNSVLTGFVIKNGYADRGGAIYCDSSSPTISNCIIVGNTAEISGGGLYNVNSNPTIANCIFSGNWANSTGSAVFCRNQSSPVIINCTISGNRCNSGYAIHGCEGPISNCIFWDNNTATVGMGTDQIYESSTPSYCCIQNWSGGGTGNIDADPCFVEAGHWDPNGTPGNKSDDFWVDGDYHLLPLSPCIDAGDPNYPDDPNKRDIDGEARIINGRIDIGADEYSFGELSDFSGDGIVNFNDLAILAYYWADSLCTSPDWCEGCDYDQSGTVDLEDLMRFAEDWLWQDESSDTNNHAPVLEAIGNKSVNENTLLTFTISATDADGDTLTYSATNLPSGATFVGQTFYWTPSYTQAGTYSVTFRASDGNAQDSETITITVNNTNRAPVLAAIGNKSVNENSTLSFSINATDADGDTITYSAQDLPSGAAFAGRIFSWTPGYTQAGTYEVNFIASDGQAQDSEEITITVNNVNQAPILSPIGNKSAFANDLLAFSVSATESDGDTITYSATGLPSGATFTSQSFIWTPTPSQVGTYTVTFIASDGQLQDSEEITITVYSADMSAPTVNILSPAADSIQVPLNNLVILHIEKTDTQLTI